MRNFTTGWAGGALVLSAMLAQACTFHHSTRPVEPARAARPDGLEMEVREVRATPNSPDTQIVLRVRNRSRARIQIDPDQAGLRVGPHRIDVQPRPEKFADFSNWSTIVLGDPFLGCLVLALCVPPGLVANVVYAQKQKEKSRLQPGEAEVFRLEFAQRPEALETGGAQVEWLGIVVPVADAADAHAGMRRPRPPTAVLAARMAAGVEGNPLASSHDPAAHVEFLVGRQGPRWGWTGSLLLGTTLGVATDIRVPVWRERNGGQMFAAFGYAGGIQYFSDRTEHGPRITLEYLWTMPGREPLFGYQIRDARLGVHLTATPLWVEDHVEWRVVFGGSAGML